MANLVKIHEQVSTRDEIYAAVGRALTRWGRLEYELSRVFSHCINPDAANPSDRAFWAIVSFEGKIKAVDAVFCDRFPARRLSSAEMQAKWSSLKNLLLRRNKVRNKLAHGSVITWSYENPATFFVPYYYSARLDAMAERGRLSSAASLPKDRMTAPEILGHAERFTSTAKKVSNLAGDVDAEVRRIEGLE